MDSITSFINYFRQTLDSEKLGVTDNVNFSKEFFLDFINYTPPILTELENYITEDHIEKFYSRLNDLKYLCVFDEELNKYWFSMRALSGALVKLCKNKSLKNARKVHQYYLNKYGDRKVLRSENWFEIKRWQFLDALDAVTEIDQLNELIDLNMILLNSYIEHYFFNLNRFIDDIKKSLNLEEDL